MSSYFPDKCLNKQFSALTLLYITQLYEHKICSYMVRLIFSSISHRQADSSLNDGKDSAFVEAHFYESPTVGQDAPTSRLLLALI
jgi:hypothetical protein